VQSDDDCCNSCEEVREAYRKKGWAITNMDLIDQVSQFAILFLFRVFSYFTSTHQIFLDNNVKTKVINI
jgi:hypothetical protein